MRLGAYGPLHTSWHYASPCMWPALLLMCEPLAATSTPGLPVALREHALILMHSCIVYALVLTWISTLCGLVWVQINLLWLVERRATMHARTADMVYETLLWLLLCYLCFHYTMSHKSGYSRAFCDSSLLWLLLVSVCMLRSRPGLVHSNLGATLHVRSLHIWMYFYVREIYTGMQISLECAFGRPSGTTSEVLRSV